MEIKLGSIVIIKTPYENIRAIRILLDMKGQMGTFISLGVLRSDEQQVFYKASDAFFIFKSAFQNIVGAIELKDIPGDLKSKIIRGVFRRDL